MKGLQDDVRQLSNIRTICVYESGHPAETTYNFLDLFSMGDDPTSYYPATTIATAGIFSPSSPNLHLNINQIRRNPGVVVTMAISVYFDTLILPVGIWL